MFRNEFVAKGIGAELKMLMSCMGTITASKSDEAFTLFSLSASAFLSPQNPSDIIRCNPEEMEIDHCIRPPLFDLFFSLPIFYNHVFRGQILGFFADVSTLTSLESLILDHNTELHMLPVTLLKMEHLAMIGLSWYVSFILFLLHVINFRALSLVKLCSLSLVSVAFL